MPLEATMMIIDNSEYMRNGDYQPTRFDAQSDAVNTVFQTKTDSNPENTVGVMTMAGKGPEVLVTHTKDLGQILGALHQASSKIGGNIDIPTAIAIAQLALKHRENKTLRQRIIVFVASPLEGPAADEKGMVKLAKKLKKNNVAVDIVCYGDGIEDVGMDGEQGKTVLKSFVENVNSSDNSHLVIIPPGSHLLSDALITSPILAGDRTAGIPEELLPGAAETGAAGPSTSNFEFGVDPSLDPELAMALRMSMQEAQAREAAEAAAAAAASAEPSSSTTANTANTAAVAGMATASSSTPTAQPTAPTQIPPPPVPPTTINIGAEELMDDEEERLLQQALAMSRQEHEHEGEDIDMEGSGESGESGDELMGDDDEYEEDEDEAIQRAIAMSMQQDQQGEEGKQRKEEKGKK
ncbi:hypothetical protein AX17_004852 [Amanita inopinata Kibby_2008]|nr:hypothetical protein AX17_004852 [Amanita inopinata Kibby_2008]